MYTRSKLFWISFMGVSLLVGLLPYLININIGIYPVLNYASFCYTSFEYFQFPCMSVSLLFDSLFFWNYGNIEISPVLDDISLWNLLDTFPRYFLTISEVFLIYCMSVSLWVNLLTCWILRSGWVIFLNFLKAFLECLCTKTK